MSGGVTPRTDRPHILFTILDWGMGHATRTWPLIILARQMGAEITIATRGTAAAWIDARMADWDDPKVPDPAPWRRIDKPGVAITYGRGKATRFRIAAQMPRFAASIRAERRWTRSTVSAFGITHVLSDNCYGCAPPSGVPSVLLTHQLRLPVPWGLRPIARFQVRRWCRPFEATWVPDFPGSVLAGQLSLPLTSNTEFMGPLSRFSFKSPAGTDATPAPVLIGLVSGPEPQRSDMESALRTCFLRDGRPAWILAGRPGAAAHQEANVLTLGDVDDVQFRAAVLGAEHIVCRSGYSTLLDLVALQRTATLVPTLGQPEQEQLARHWHSAHGWPTLDVRHLAGHTFAASEAQPVSSELPNLEARLRKWLFDVPTPPTTA